MTTVNRQFVTIRLAGQLLGIPVLEVHDVLSPHNITAIPRSPKAVAGVLNLRGKIVTAIDLRERLSLTAFEDVDRCMSVVVEHQGEPYSLLIDSVGEVLALPEDRFERNPVTLDARWQEVSSGIYRLEDQLLVILDVERLLDFGLEQATAA
ncbi:MAG: chemotaxis protein CheW [Kordiimonas sp.]|nr:chemotaxis protein CheW [Kordiimonas sp.]|tara:strand:- start:5607 stop:6059 length:453 start_codon:yes stop_codon:yes gene_type:complete